MVYVANALAARTGLLVLDNAKSIILPKFYLAIAIRALKVSTDKLIYHLISQSIF
ncbi:hypothetical protein IC765_09495 [Acinetobacter seifertii]|uniref:Uncharacterized protein n=1 Tax=Acinetobacter seifertii TaxID=1530123 RepID=A0A7H2Q5R3_9GAMM|nr:hypothetical protein IC795_10090 [Acinetobacter seifertii]QNY16063.1 hypothetical protein IC765_09495 [Acinetobacter seifertii]